MDRLTVCIETAVDRMNAFPNSDPRTIRAIVFMTDGEFNYYGDPLARGRGYSNTYEWENTYITRHRWFSGELGGFMVILAFHLHMIIR